MTSRNKPIKLNPTDEQDDRNSTSPDAVTQPVTCAHTTWQAATSHIASALDEEGDRLLRKDAPPGLWLVKSGADRRVYAGEWGGERVVVKVFNAQGFKNRLRMRFFGTHAEREWYLLRECRVRGIPVPEPLAVGVNTKDGAQSALVMQELPNAVPLTEACAQTLLQRPSEAHRTATRLIDRVACLLATAHRRGFVHPDGHPRNILIAGDNRDHAGEAYFVDVYGGKLRSHEPVPRPDRVEALAQLDKYFLDKAPRTRRFRFLRRYQAHAGLDAFRDLESGVRGVTLTAAHRARIQLQRQARKGVDGAWLRDVAYARKRLAARLARHRDRRLRKDGKYFAAIRLEAGWRGQVALQIGPRHRFPVPGVQDRSLAEWKAVLTPIIQEAQNGVDDVFTCDAERIHCERTVASGTWERLAWSLGRSPHRAAFLRAHRARHRDRAAPLVLGYLDRWSGGLIRESILVLPSGAAAGASLRKEASKGHELSSPPPVDVIGS